MVLSLLIGLDFPCFTLPIFVEGPIELSDDFEKECGTGCEL